MANGDLNPAMEGSRKHHYRNYSVSENGSWGHRMTVHSVRGAILTSAVLGTIHVNTLQWYMDALWKWLLTTWVYNSVYFETWFVTACYAILTAFPLAMHHIAWFDRYKINPSVRYTHTTILAMLLDAIIYDTPLMLLDTFKIKRYAGVDSAQFEERERYWIQTTRALPREAPAVGQFVFQLAASILAFDAVFFLIHYGFHRNSLLYKYIHRHHHKHDVIYCHVTNQLTIPERLALILSANEALKIFSSHPLTRTAFVPVFIWMLIDNHSGYDVPWGAQHVIPVGLYGGPVKHYYHHEHGGRYYQPFFSYLDNLLLKEPNNNDELKDLWSRKDH